MGVNTKKMVLLLWGGVLGAVLFYGCAAKREAFPPVLPVDQQYNDTDEAIARAQDYFIRARDYERKGLTQMAQRFYELALALDPQSKTLRNILVKNYIAASNYPLALTLLKEADSLGSNDLRLLASIYLQTGESLKATEVLEQIKDKTEQDVFSLALLYQSMDLKSKSVELLNQFLARNPQSFDVATKLVHYALLEKQFDKVDSIISSLSVYHQKNPDLFALKGTVCLFREDTAAAMENYNKALSLDPDHEESLQTLAQVFIQKENFPAAIDYYKQLAEESNSEAYLFPLAVLYLFEEHFEEAESLFVQLLEQSPDDPEINYYIGVVFANTERISQAKQHFERALELDPKNEEALSEYSNLLIREEEYEKADTIITRYIEHHSNSPVPYRLKGYIHSFRKEYDLAADAAKSALSLDSLSYGVWFELGNYLEQNEQFEEATEAFRKALVLRPGDPMVSNYLGYMWAEKGIKLDSAKILIETALAADPGNGAYLDSYAWVFYQMGDYDNAYIYQQKALQRLNDDPVLFSHLGDILYKLGDKSGALKAYLKSLDMDSKESDRIRLRVIELKYLSEQKEELSDK